MQFGDDWPGVFIRGDNAMFFAGAVRAALAVLPENDRAIDVASLRRLGAALQSCLVEPVA
jgi:hypothetical protein